MVFAPDWLILHWIQAVLRCGVLDAVLPKLSLLGDKGFIWIAAGIALLCTKRYRKYGVILLLGLLSGLIVGNGLLKHLVARPRPCWLDGSVSLLVAKPLDFSFPSGHTLSSTIAAYLLTRTNRRFGYVAIPLAALIAFSRLYLYVHFPSDVLGGVLLGLLLGFLTWKLSHRVLNRLEAHRQ